MFKVQWMILGDAPRALGLLSVPPEITSVERAIGWARDEARLIRAVGVDKPNGCRILDKAGLVLAEARL